MCNQIIYSVKKVTQSNSLLSFENKIPEPG